jgi:hypothetical protein
VATRIIAPTSALWEVTEMAPFEGLAAADVELEEDALEADEPDADEPDAGDEPDVDEAAASALPTSGGNINGADEIATEPSAFMISGFMANTFRVNNTFSTTADWAQEGIELMSMLEPQFAAMVPLVVMLVYEAYVEISPVESFAITEDIIPETEVGALKVEGGLMIPNIPCSQ